MTRTIASQTSADTHYSLTIDDSDGTATNCSCPDRFYRHHQCKHMRSLDEQLVKDQTFAMLMQQYDIRNQAPEERTCAICGHELKRDTWVCGYCIGY